MERLSYSTQEACKNTTESKFEIPSLKREKNRHHKCLGTHALGKAFLSHLVSLTFGNSILEFCFRTPSLAICLFSLVIFLLFQQKGLCGPSFSLFVVFILLPHLILYCGTFWSPSTGNVIGLRQSRVNQHINYYYYYYYYFADGISTAM